MAVIPTGIVSLDAALGIGGLPRGRIVEIFGPASSGKTTLALHAAAQAQRLGGTAAFIDAEHALDAAYACRIGVDLATLLVSQPDCGDEALGIAEALASSRVVDLIVVDSVAALVPREELVGAIGGDFFAFHEHLMSRALRRLSATAARTGVCLLFLNQLRSRSDAGYGSPETTTGGNALKLHAAIRAEVRKVAPAVVDGAAGARTRVRLLKNSLAAAGRTADFDLLYGEGVIPETDAFDMGVMQGIVQRTASGFTHRARLLGPDRETARRQLKRDPAECHALMEELRRSLGLPCVTASKPR